jgi:CO/xanthine dehydrogenase FAD-binding subunit
MRSQFEYIRATSLEHALEFLANHGAQTSILAGGTDLMITVRKGELSSRYVLDVSRLRETGFITKEDGLLRIGATASFTEIIESSLVQELAPVLVSACSLIGSIQIRNTGTIGGNVANASPAADAVPPLVVHNARAVVRSGTPERIVPLDQLIVGPYRTSLGPGELITRFLLDRAEPEHRHSFQRVARRRAMAIARVNLAAVGTSDSQGRVVDVRISAGSVTPAPARMRCAEEFLLGKKPDMELIRQAAEMVSREMIHLSGIRLSTEYKKPAVEGLVKKALSEMFGT